MNSLLNACVLTSVDLQEKLGCGVYVIKDNVCTQEELCSFKEFCFPVRDDDMRKWEMEEGKREGELGGKEACPY